MLTRLVLIAVLTPTPLVAQDIAQSFIIDATRPYVYLKFDHLANRKPLSPDESSKGLWLRLVNNCRVPIIVGVFNPGTNDPGVGLFDKIVPVELPRGLIRARPSESGESGRAHNLPQGYSSEVFSTTMIAPGDNLLFSLPINHVSPWWYLQITFNLGVPGAAYGSEPYSKLSFHWQDIPDKVRAGIHP